MTRTHAALLTTLSLSLTAGLAHAGPVAPQGISMFTDQPYNTVDIVSRIDYVRYDGLGASDLPSLIDEFYAIPSGPEIDFVLDESDRSVSTQTSLVGDRSGINFSSVFTTTSYYDDYGNGFQFESEDVKSTMYFRSEFVVDASTVFSLDITGQADTDGYGAFDLRTDFVSESLYSFDTRQQGETDSATVTLGPGTYFFSGELFSNTPRPAAVPGQIVTDSSSTTLDVALTVVPTPSTLAAVFPLGLLAARRRR